MPDWARRLSALLDNAIRIPGTELRIGLDPILGALLPELGDALDRGACHSRCWASRFSKESPSWSWREC